MSEASREYGIKDSVISRWRQEFMECAPQIFEAPDGRDAQAEQIAELERMLGRMAVQVEMAKKSSGIRTIGSRTAANGTEAGAEPRLSGTVGV
jgi:transposase